MDEVLPQAALAYAAAGWPLVPLVAGTKKPHIKTGEDHAQAATCDADRVREWWRRWPEAGIGIVPARGGFLVVDIDGEEGRGSFLSHPGPFPATCASVTGREGYGAHWWYRLPPGAEVPRGRTLAPGLELKGAGNLVVAPPSQHRSGRRYAWDVPPPFLARGGFPVAPQPSAAWMLEQPERPRPVVARATTALDGHDYTAAGARRLDGILAVLEQGGGARHPRLVFAVLAAAELVQAGHLGHRFAAAALESAATSTWAGEDDPGEIADLLAWGGLGEAP